MHKAIDEHLIAVEAFKPANAEELEAFRLKYLGKKGILNDLFTQFKAVPNEEKKAFGQAVNRLKNAAESAVLRFKSELEEQKPLHSENDLSRPGDPIWMGSEHPVSIVRNEIVDIFKRVGFSVSEGPEIEDDWHNFSALNFPEEHPARDMQDTFFVHTDPDWALRTHTSSVQVREMERLETPIRIIAPGRVFRNEAISSRSHCIFHQIEGLYIDKNVSFADLKQTLLYFAREFFGADTKIRLRPSYFPFTEPSAEMDIWWGLETETDYRMTKGTGWLEVMGCGMVDPAVLEASGIDPNVYSGYAFGMGVERITMQRYNIPDIRMLFENDMRFLKQFKGTF
ncbi:phenylalanine--tRNA ligase subunit alpha [Phaeocystidibacter marisrubri]|uniref:Phenylalanine--tRNA ligase alpha subunit n=1 Tax=Phaeocystidibacter marisrubri TaxID=1577780 RepID=A0A6L3ZFK4_9FLAO|nr:phenylalanine--tRNA ligase subunit alpha [Phaeocystidibacter marisrubri]KAB2816513.1 phenylalanine--tRNA ligase subunit alpha [Phaeocystidibacter marisrubri]GGH69437.1 phenylalanine--tRNA ligase alpha subunit [Phaeocystidibacter marisrubri]